MLGPQTIRVSVRPGSTTAARIRDTTAAGVHETIVFRIGTRQAPVGAGDAHASIRVNVLALRQRRLRSGQCVRGPERPGHQSDEREMPMRFTRRAARNGVAVAAAVALATTGAVAAPQASAVEACRANGLCLYYNTGFTDMHFVTERTGAGCWGLNAFGLDEHVNSYVNNLPVTVYMRRVNWDIAWSIRPGGSSSNSTPFVGEAYVCT